MTLNYRQRPTTTRNYLYTAWKVTYKIQGVRVAPPPRQWMGEWIHRCLVNLSSPCRLEIMLVIAILRAHVELQRMYGTDCTEWLEQMHYIGIWTGCPRHAWLDVVIRRRARRCYIRMSPLSTGLQSENGQVVIRQLLLGLYQFGTTCL